MFRSWSEDVHIVLILSSDCFCHFFHKMNFVIFVTKVNRYKVSCVLSCFMIAHILKKRTKSGGGHTFSEFACYAVVRLLTDPFVVNHHC